MAKTDQKPVKTAFKPTQAGLDKNIPKQDKAPVEKTTKEA